MDVSFEPMFANLLGYTQEELESYFAPHISAAASLLKISEEQLLDDLKANIMAFALIVMPKSRSTTRSTLTTFSCKLSSILRALLFLAPIG